MSPTTLAVKDPKEVKRYRIDWNNGPLGSPGILASLGSDTITGTPTWVVPNGITKDSQVNDTTTTTVTLSSGTHGTDYTLTCRITTVGGETLEQAIVIPVRDKDK